MFKIGSLVILKLNKSSKNYIFCWAENKLNSDIKAIILEPGEVGVYLGLWDKNKYGDALLWHKVLLGKKEYLFTLDQLDQLEVYE